MTPAELRRLGEQLYGKRWQTAFARELPVSTRTVRRWLAGASDPHPAIVKRIRELAAAKEKYK